MTRRRDLRSNWNRSVSVAKHQTAHMSHRLPGMYFRFSNHGALARRIVCRTAPASLPASVKSRTSWALIVTSTPTLASEATSSVGRMTSISWIALFVGQVDVVVGAADEATVSVYVDPQDIGPGAAIQHEIGRIQDTTARRGLISRVEQAHYQRSGTPVHNPETPTRIMRSYNDIRRLCRD